MALEATTMVRSFLIPTLMACACAEQTLDLRTPEGLVVPCAADERINPETELCSRCDRVLESPDERCLCGSEPLPDGFPWCVGETPFRCLPCLALEQCRDFDSTTDAVGDCGRVRACCDEIERNNGGTACCEATEIAVCFAHPTLEDALVLECVAPTTCCDTDECSESSDCEGFQECENGMCRPGCEPSVEFCCEGCGCQCEERDGPT